ncbi:SDR family oxidoreductase [Phycicoccus sp. CSK15P-2]|uniref:SDR family oxidoreductase n=1 Tax=Phycicoccus sp. CSK15P-2 TaxID=2807627 RepID=UPI001951A3F9|nr:SDR family oxidoreductase [Phycicoccus sp. CSK15P-2]MBM6405679.1 SDR family oxidoreductase [Phycicoccus sp. CSK15P-2]
MQDLVAGHVAVVTGAARGIGLAVVEALTSRGVAVACLDHPDADTTRVTEVCRAAGVPHLVLAVDVRDRDAVHAAVARSAELGPVSYAVNCAGVDSLVQSATVSAEDWKRVLDIDLDGVMFACQAEHDVLLASGGGAIVNIASMSGHIVNRGVSHAAYSAAKAGVIHVSKALAVEWAAAGIRVNSLSPGYTRTPMTADIAPELEARFESETPMGRFAEVEEIAEPVVFLLGRRASYVTGADLLVDGGFCAW